MLCCVCLLDAHSVIGVHDEIGKEHNIANIISKHLWLKVEEMVSSNICTICWRKIYDFHEFYQTVERAHKECKSVHQDIANIKEEDNSNQAYMIKEELIDERDSNNVYLETEIDYENSNSSKNPLEEIEKNRSSDDDYDQYENYSESSDEYLPKDKEDNTMVTISKDNKKLKRGRKKKGTKLEDNEAKPKRKKQIFNRLDPTHTEEMIRKHVPMGCNLCVFVGQTFGDIVTHFKANHCGVRPFITCCDKKFTKRFYLAQHAMTHENPTCFSCAICNKSFTTTGGLQKHNLNYHAPDEERTFACELCPRKFARQHLLQLHKTSHIPREEWNVFCTKCPTPKAFASAYLLNIHDNKLHKREKNICNVCAKEIKDKKAFEKHVREHYEGSGPKLKCPYEDCDSWLKDEDNLKIHLRRHNPDNETYQCPLCDRVCPNRRALASHKVYVHSKEIFKCEQCDKTFKKAISLKEHMAQHTGEVLYNCPFCTRTFNSNANMHSHKKKQHPVEWEASKRQKLQNNITGNFSNTS